MYGWRAKIGVIKPIYHGKTLARWFANAPAGVEIAPAIIGLAYDRASTADELLAALDTAESLGRRLVEAQCDCVVLAGVPLTVTRGLEFEQQWARRLEDELGVPVVPPVEPYASFMLERACTSVAVTSYFNANVNEAIVTFLRDAGLEARPLPEWPRTPSASDAMPLSHIEASHITPEVLYRFCRSGIASLGSTVDGLCVMGAFDSQPVMMPLSEDLAIPVVNQDMAQQWVAYRRLGIRVAFATLMSESRHGLAPTAS